MPINIPRADTSKQEATYADQSFRCIEKIIGDYSRTLEKFRYLATIVLVFTETMLPLIRGSS